MNKEKKNILKHKEFDNVEKVSKILDKLEDENMIKYVEEIKNDNNDINIYIGKENNLDEDIE